ncbi:MAG: FKBP-type peptidyl-prolyl cis-trans isomerase [Fimbriimonadaceae bacterium]
MVLLVASAQAAPAPVLGLEVVAYGNGPFARPGDRLTLHFRAETSTGQVVVDTEMRGLPYRLELGDPNLIPLWKQGLNGMQPREVRKLTAPPEFLAGPEGNPPVVPPGTELVVTVKLVELMRPTEVVIQS